MKKILSIMLTLFIPTLSLTAKGTNPSHGGRGASTYTNPASTEYAGSAKYHIGDYAEGGVIIWLTSDGQHGLVSAITDVPGGTYQWATTSSYYASHSTGATYNNSLPLSYSNTTPALNYGGGQNQVILDSLNQNPGQGPQNQLQAALAAQGYSYTDPTTGITYTDWFLPASSELSQMYAIRDTIDSVALAHGGVALRTDNFYWSSREYNDFVDNAWILSFAVGDQGIGAKDHSCAVRCVRAF